MSAPDRWATKLKKRRQDDLEDFWRKTRRGPLDEDMAKWTLEEGLTPRTARENYWDLAVSAGLIRIVNEKGRRFWEYCDLSAEEESFIESVIFDKAMKLGLTRKQARIAHQFSLDEKCTFEDAVNHIYGRKK